MDLSKINSLAKCVPRNITKISDLVIGKIYVVEDMRKIKTQYGEKIIVDLENNLYCYLPARVSRALLLNDEEGLKNFQLQMKKITYGLKKLEGEYNPIEFIIVNEDS